MKYDCQRHVRPVSLPPSPPQPGSGKMTESADEMVWVWLPHRLLRWLASEREPGIDECGVSGGTGARHGTDENGARHEIICCRLHHSAEMCSRSTETMHSTAKMSASGLGLMLQKVSLLGLRHDGKGRMGGYDAKVTLGCLQHSSDLHVWT